MCRANIVGKKQRLPGTSRYVPLFPTTEAIISVVNLGFSRLTEVVKSYRVAQVALQMTVMSKQLINPFAQSIPGKMCSSEEVEPDVEII